MKLRPSRLLYHLNFVNHELVTVVVVPPGHTKSKFTPKSLLLTILRKIDYDDYSKTTKGNHHQKIIQWWEHIVNCHKKGMVAQTLASLEALSPLLWRGSDTTYWYHWLSSKAIESEKEKEESLFWFDRRCRRGLFSDLGGGHSVAAATGISGELRSIFRTTRSLQVPLSWPYVTLISSFFSCISFTFYVFWKKRQPPPQLKWNGGRK